MINELEDAIDITERKATPSWDYDVSLSITSYIQRGFSLCLSLVIFLLFHFFFPLWCTQCLQKFVGLRKLLPGVSKPSYWALNYLTKWIDIDFLRILNCSILILRRKEIAGCGKGLHHVVENQSITENWKMGRSQRKLHGGHKICLRKLNF